jgi:hypothetical protein
VTVTSFNEVSAAGIAGQADGRSVVLLLDDNAVSLSATNIMQSIARLFVSYARPADTIAVVRLTHRDDEVAGDLKGALDRIAEYRPGSLSFFGRDMRDDALQTVARVARQLLPVVHEAGHYYLLGYTPTARSRELHSIDVSTRPSGLRVRARHRRGD